MKIYDLYTYESYILISLPSYMIWQGSRMRLGVTAKVGRIWKWSNGVKISEKGIFWCVSITNNVESCKKFNEKAQTVNFSVFTMCGRELPAEKTYFWWKLAKRKRIFLNVFHWYDLNRVYHEKADVQSIPKML